MQRSEPPDYRDLLDTDYLAYVDRVNFLFPPSVSNLPIAEQRVRYDEMCKSLHPGRPAGVTVRDTAIRGPAGQIGLRVYSSGQTSGPRLLFFHGGGFVFGGLDSHDDTCGDLCARTGLDIVSATYRLAPEHIHPSAFDDAMAAFAWITADAARPVILCGESAGGNLAACAAHAARGTATPPIGQVLIYPLLGSEPGASHNVHAKAPLLTAEDIEACRDVRSGGHPPPRDPSFEPLADDDYSRLPNTIVVTAECDPLSSEGDHYCRRIRASGGAAIWRQEPRLTHSFLRARSTVPRAQEAFDRIANDILTLAKS